MSAFRMIAAAATLALCSAALPQSAIGQAGVCGAFAGHWRGHTNTYEPFEITISPDGKTLTYGGFSGPCVVKGGKLDYHYPAFEFSMGPDGKGTARYGTQVKTIALQRVD